MLREGKEILPSSSHAHTIIFLHGHGSNGSEFSDDFMDIDTSGGRKLAAYFPHLKWVFPSASTSLMPDSEHAEQMLQWFNLSDTQHPNSTEKDEAKHIAAAAKDIADLVKRESGIIGPENALLLERRKWGGFIGLSSLLSSRDTLSTMLDENEALSTPLFLAHCQDDEVIRIANGYELQDELRGFGMNVTWREYEEGGHWINEEQGERDIVEFIQAICNGKPLPDAVSSD